jgi:hypothetical protein
MAKPEPAILAQSRVYIQRRKGKKLQLGIEEDIGK